MQVAVITVAREPSYLAGTLASLVATSACRSASLFVGSPDTRDVESFRAAHRVREMPPELWERIEHLRPGQRAVGNFLQALQDDTDDILLCEDDIEFKPGWRRELINGSLDLDGLITLYVHPRTVLAPKAEQPGFVVIPRPTQFFGTLALFVPCEIRGELAAWIDARLGPDVEPFDELIRCFVDARQVPFYATTESWVDHRGDVSAITENADHGPRRSPRW